jgi:hypothetical protein
MLPDAMGTELEREILRIAEERGEAGIPMGAIVDALVEEGFEEQAVELAVWELLQHRRLTPNGFVARTLIGHGRDGHSKHRVYEFVLIPWSPALDRQLDLEFDR